MDSYRTTIASNIPAPDAGPGDSRRRYIEAGIIVVFWGFVAVLTMAHHAWDSRFGDTGLRPGEALHIISEYAAWALVTPCVFWLARQFRLERPHLARNLALHIVIAVAVAAAIDLWSHMTFNALITDARPRSVSLLVILQGFHILAEILLYLLVLSAGLARDYFVRYQERLNESAKLQAQLADARLQALRMQINPHFLFNTLHTISTYVERDPRGVRRMIARLSELLRYTLEKTDVKEVPLRQELEFLDGYLDIQQIRFDSLEVHHDIDPNVMDALVPNLILQPLVENAVKHGVGNLERGGRIELRAWQEGGRLHLTVRDDGPGLPDPSGDGAPVLPSHDAASRRDGDAAVVFPAGIGLRNTRERLQSMYGDEQHLTLESHEEGGVIAHISLPFHTPRDLFTTTV